MSDDRAPASPYANGFGPASFGGGDPLSDLAPPQLDRDAMRAWVAEQCDPARKSLQCVGFALGWNGAGRPEAQRVDFALVPKGLDEEARAKEVDRVVGRFVLAAQNDARVRGPLRQPYVIHAGFSSDPLGAMFVGYPFPVTPSRGAELGTRFDPMAGGGHADLVGDLQANNSNLSRTNEVLVRLLATHLTESARDARAAENAARQAHLDLFTRMESLWLGKEQLLDQREERQERSDNRKVLNQAMLDGVGFLRTVANKVLEDRMGPSMLSGMSETLSETLQPGMVIALLSNLEQAKRDKLRPLVETVYKAWPEPKKLEWQQLMAARAQEQSALAAAAEGMAVPGDPDESAHSAQSAPPPAPIAEAAAQPVEPVAAPCDTVAASARENDGGGAPAAVTKTPRRRRKEKGA